MVFALMCQSRIQIKYFINEFIALPTDLENFFVNFGTFWGLFVLSSEKKIRRRIFFDTYPLHIETYRKFAYPSPPKKVRRLLWTAP